MKLKCFLWVVVFFWGVMKVEAQYVTRFAYGFGSIYTDDITKVCTDKNSNIYTAGNFTGNLDFNPGPPLNSISSGAATGIFIQKLDSSGLFKWAKKIAGSGSKYCYDMRLDSSGNIYLTGTFTGTLDFDPGAGTYNLTSAGNNDFFIAKLDSSCNLIWANQFGSTGDDICYSISVDKSGNVYSTGVFSDTVDFNPGSVVSNLAAAISNMFILKLDSGGNFIWANQIVSTFITPFVIENISGESIYIKGNFFSTTDFDPGFGIYNMTSAPGTSAGSGVYSGFLLKLDTSGIFIWSKIIESHVNGLYYLTKQFTIDNQNNLLFTGLFGGTCDFDPGAGTYNLTVTNGINDIFIQKLDSSGNLLWAKSIGAIPMAGGTNSGVCIATDSSSNVYVGGQFEGTVDFDPGVGQSLLTSMGQRDFFLIKLDVNCNLIWASGSGSIKYDKTKSIAIDAEENVIVAGDLNYFSGSANDTVDLDLSAQSQNYTIKGATDFFIIKLNQASTLSLSTDGSLDTSFIDSKSYLIKLYPNPTKDLLNIENISAGAIVKLYDLSGRTVLSQKAGSSKCIINTGNLENGVFIVEVSDEAGRSFDRVVINR